MAFCVPWSIRMREPVIVRRPVTLCPPRDARRRLQGLFLPHETHSHHRMGVATARPSASVCKRPTTRAHLSRAVWCKRLDQSLRFTLRPKNRRSPQRGVVRTLRVRGSDQTSNAWNVVRPVIAPEEANLRLHLRAYPPSCPHDRLPSRPPRRSSPSPCHH